MEHNREKVQATRIAYRQEIARYPGDRRRFIDESGINVALTWAFGRALGEVVVMDNLGAHKVKGNQSVGMPPIAPRSSDRRRQGLRSIRRQARHSEPVAGVLPLPPVAK